MENKDQTEIGKLLNADIDAIVTRGKKKAKKKKKIFVLTIVAFATIVTSIIVGQKMSVKLALNKQYSEAKALSEQGKYQEAISIFEELGDYKDSAMQIEHVIEQIHAEKYSAAKELSEQGKYQEAISIFEELGEYEDSAKQIEHVIELINAEKYLSADDLLQQGKYQEALEAFYELGNYKDSAKRRETVWDEISNQWAGVIPRKTISHGNSFAVAVKKDGSVIAAGGSFERRRGISSWTDIVAVSAEYTHTLGLKANGKVVATGDNSKGQCNVSSWTDIVAVSAGYFFSAGLKKDGTVVAVGDNSYGQCDVSDWIGIVAVSAGYYGILGLKSDGTVVSTGFLDDASDWTDIVAVSAGTYSAGLKKDGTIVVLGSEETSQVCRSEAWKDIIAISMFYDTLTAIRSDGTILGYDSIGGIFEIPGQKNIVTVMGTGNDIYGLRRNGTVARIEGYWEVGEMADWTNIMIP